jgi:hypothetical protein
VRRALVGVQAVGLAVKGQGSGCWFGAMYREVTTARQSILGAPAHFLVAM